MSVVSSSATSFACIILLGLLQALWLRTVYVALSPHVLPILIVFLTSTTSTW